MLNSQTVQARLALSVNLSADRKGIHMSRLVQDVVAWPDVFSPHNFGSFLETVCERQGSTRARLELAFTYFLQRVAPASGNRAPQAYASIFTAEKRDLNLFFEQEVEVPVMTLCPCSKAISDYGAHSQRGLVRVRSFHFLSPDGKAPQGGWISLEEMVERVEASASSPVYPVLKREDERVVTMAAYDQPVFVEDLARNIVLRLQGPTPVSGLSRFQLHVLNQESIHAHDAFAFYDHPALS